MAKNDTVTVEKVEEAPKDPRIVEAEKHLNKLQDQLSEAQANIDGWKQKAREITKQVDEQLSLIHGLNAIASLPPGAVNALVRADALSAKGLKVNKPQ